MRTRYREALLAPSRREVARPDDRKNRRAEALQAPRLPVRAVMQALRERHEQGFAKGDLQFLVGGEHAVIVVAHPVRSAARPAV
jgi:hypothetical protein